MKYLFTAEYFLNTNDGNALTTNERIADALKLLKDDEDYIEVSGYDIQCKNEHDLRETLGL